MEPHLGVQIVYLNRLRFRGVKPLSRDIPVDGRELPEAARKRLLLQGGNGSGKTTILETISSLWRFWGEWIEIGDHKPPPRQHVKHFLAQGAFAAMEIVAMSPKARPVWIGIGTTKEWDELRNDHPELPLAGLFTDHAYTGRLSGSGEWRIHLPATGGIDLLEFRHQGLIGKNPLPNIVYFPSEDRTIQKDRQPRAELLDLIPYNWVARFNRKINLDSVLLTVKAREPKRFEQCLRFVNLALAHRGKHITGFGENGRLVVEGEAESGQPYKHAIEELSSGEKQMLLMLGFTAAFLRPGGILLIDEPDLHIHISMVDQLLAALEAIVQERQGQLIVASHSEQVWNWFSREEEHIELGPWRKDQP